MIKKGYKQTKEHIAKRVKKFKKFLKHNPNHMRGENNPRWKGGRRKYYCYIQILKPDYPFSTKSGYILEHRYTMEQHLKRRLKSNEVVHHINGNTIDNRIENLLLTTKNKHGKMHPENGIRTRFKKGLIPWSKGRKGVCLNAGRTHFRKGHKPIAPFKKGHIPWNKKISHCN